MGKFLKTSAALGVLAFCSLAASAQAATIVVNDVTLDTSPTGTPLSEQIKENAAGTGNNLVLIAQPSANLVDFSSPQTIRVGDAGNGFAFVSGVNGNGFSQLTITPEAPASGFTAFKFNMFPQADSINGQPSNFYGDIILTLLNGGPNVVFSNVAFGEAGQNRFLVDGNSDQIFTSIIFQNLHTGTADTSPAWKFDSIRQMSFDLASNSPVPEPSTWALMILGFGAIGATMRRKHRQTVSYKLAR